MLDYIVKELPSVLKQFKQLDLSKVSTGNPTYTNLQSGEAGSAQLRQHLSGVMVGALLCNVT